VSAPNFIPPDRKSVRGYSSPPRRVDNSKDDRPGELAAGQPKGKRLGSAGPDQGYAYRLVSEFDDRLMTGSIEKEDAVSGCVALAMKRASIFGRAPVIHDLTAAFTIYGFLQSDVAPGLVVKREELFPEVRSSHHYSERRAIVDAVSNSFLKKSLSDIKQDCKNDWTCAFI